MQRIKLFVFLFFTLFAVIFYGARWFTPTASGQTEGSALSAPTGVNASDGNYADKVGIRWETVRNATIYHIFRNTENDSATATDVGTTAANYYFDPSAAAGQNYFYFVRAENGAAVSHLSDADAGLRANGNIFTGPFPPLDPPSAPAGNPVTATKAALGKALFWDEQLSSTRTVACGTCHRSSEGGSDPRTIFNDSRSRNPGVDGIAGTGDDVFGSPGVPQNNADGTYTLNNFFGFNEQVSPRKAPSYLNAGYSPNGLFLGRSRLRRFPRSDYQRRRFAERRVARKSGFRSAAQRRRNGARRQKLDSGRRPRRRVAPARARLRRAARADRLD